MTEIEGLGTGVSLRRNLSSLLLFFALGKFQLGLAQFSIKKQGMTDADPTHDSEHPIIKLKVLICSKILWYKFE